MTGVRSPRLPLDPLHPDHEMYQRLLAGVVALDRWDQAQAVNLAAGLYADLRAKQPHMLATDLGRVLGGDLAAEQPSLFATPRSGYHSHTGDPAALLFSTPIAAANRPAHEALTPFERHTTIDSEGYLTDPGITRTPIPAISHAPMPQVNGIVLHRTESSTAASTLSTWRTRDAGTGAHFLIDRDGTTHQTVSVDRQAWHVGAIRSRGEVEGTITPDDQRALDAARNGQAEWRGTAVRAVSRVESSRPYPERYPTNADSVGIEVVGRYHFGLTNKDVYEHDAISRKTPGEGAGLYVPAAPGMAPDAADAGRVPIAGPQR